MKEGKEGQKGPKHPIKGKEWVFTDTLTPAALATAISRVSRS